MPYSVLVNHFGHIHVTEILYLNNMSFRVINLPYFTTEARIHCHP